MKKRNVVEVLNTFAVGFAAAVYGAATVACTAAAIHMFRHVSADSGYMAVADFAVGAIATAAAIGILYTGGAWVLRKGRFSI